MRVLPCEDQERVVRRPRTGGCASVCEVSPLAGVLEVVVVIIDFVVSDNSVRGGGSGVEFSHCGSDAG